MGKIAENRARLAEKFASTKIGGKGTQRRTHKTVHKTTINSDSKLKSHLKKFGAQPLPDIAEVNMFKDDSTIMQFKRPEGTHYFIPITDHTIEALSICRFVDLCPVCLSKGLWLAMNGFVY